MIDPNDPNRAVEAGHYTAEGQPPLVVIEAGKMGPWVTWRFEYETDGEATKSLWYMFNEMLTEGGYKREP